MKNTQNHRRGSSPNQEKEIGFISNQIEFSFAEPQKEMTIPLSKRTTGRYDKSTRHPSIVESNSVVQ